MYVHIIHRVHGTQSHIFITVREKKREKDHPLTPWAKKEQGKKKNQELKLDITIAITHQ